MHVKFGRPLRRKLLQVLSSPADLSQPKLYCTAAQFYQFVGCLRCSNWLPSYRLDGDTHTHAHTLARHTSRVDKRHIELQFSPASLIFRWREESQWDKLSPLEFVVSPDPISSASGPEFRGHTAAGVRGARPLRPEENKKTV